MSDELKYRSDKFQCPHCHVVAQQSWFISYQLSSAVFRLYSHIYLDYRVNIRDYNQEAIEKFLKTAKSKFPKHVNSFLPRNLSIATCQSCGDYSLWVDEKIVSPRKLPIEPPNDDLNEEIKSFTTVPTL